jgi:hypothetical protein
VRCTFDFYDKHLSTNIMVLRTFLGYLMQRRTFLGYLMQQSCKIFVEIHLKHITKGAEHRNI